MRDSLLVEHEGFDVGDSDNEVLEKRQVSSLLQIATEKVLERFIPPR